MIDNNIDQ